MRLEHFIINEAGLTKLQLQKLEGYQEFDEIHRKTFEPTFDKIMKDCQPFLRQLKKSGELMYRNMGSPSANHGAGVKDVRMDRAPRDTNSRIHSVFDNVMDDLIGFKGRSQAIFCSGDPNWGSAYGASNMVFPIGSFKFAWSPDIRDSYDFVGNSGLIRAAKTLYEKEWMVAWKERYGEGKEGTWHMFGDDVIDRNNVNTREQAIEYYVNYYSQPEHNSRIFSQEGEKGLRKSAKQALRWEPLTNFEDYMWQVKEWIDDNLLTGLESDLLNNTIEKVIIDKLKYSDKNLDKAIKSRHEIMVHCKSYYYLNTAHYERFVRLRLYGKSND